jgi:uncharacterized protein (DUF1015 family)
MAELRPFRALRPRPDLARDIAAYPYDVVSSDEARALARGNPWSFLHVGKPEVDLDPALAPDDERVYLQGRANLERMIAAGALVRDPVPCLYLYRQRLGEHAQVGLVGAASVGEYERGLVKRHELTRRDKEDDRTRHLATLAANAEPVFLAYRARPDIDALVAGLTTRPPAHDFVADDGIGHTLWVVSDRAEVDALTGEMARVPCLYVADGHHRTAAAVRHGQEMRSRHPEAGAAAPWERFLAVLFAHDQLRILDYNRLVRDLGGLSAAELLARLDERFIVTPTAEPRPPRPRTFGMLLAGRWHRLEARPGSWPEGDPVRGLDVSILHDNLLAPLLGIGDARSDERVDFVGGIRGPAELERRCREGWAVAFTLHPTSLDQLMAVADLGLLMPPKSTWFEPKLRSGLTVRLLDE